MELEHMPMQTKHLVVDNLDTPEGAILRLRQMAVETAKLLGFSKLDHHQEWNQMPF